jgi:hypothetical protein
MSPFKYRNACIELERGQGATLKAIGERYGISAERVRCILLDQEWSREGRPSVKSEDTGWNELE